jgi:oxygen-independent coproporphyrinogen-3 oxidase
MERVRQHGHGAHEFEAVTPDQRAREMLMMGLRLMEGVDLAAFTTETGKNFSAFVNPQKAKLLVEEGLLDISGTAVAATRAGRQRLNAVLAFLLS